MTYRIYFLALILLATAAPSADAAERLCDPSRENCRTPLLDLINKETQGIDVAFWFMEDARYTNALAAARKRGVPVRVLVDTKANPSYPNNATMIKNLADAGIPIRRIASRWLHWKFMVFAGQNVVEFGSANYSPHGFVPTEPGVDFIDEAILFTDDAALVNSFKRKFDDAWISTNEFSNYANVTGALVRSYPLYSIASSLNFPPSQDFGARSVTRYNAETVGIDVLIFRMGDGRHADAMIAARKRGVPVRIYIEQGQYRDRKRPASAYDMDRLYAAGITMRQRKHAGWMHEKLTLLRGQRMAIIGSQNWSHTPGQYEHNYFTTKSWLYQALSDQFARKWTSTAESTPFVPQAPTIPLYNAPANAAAVSTSTVTLRWNGGPFAHKYDLYFGTSSTPPLFAANLALGWSASSTDYKTYTVSGLAPNTTYYWRIVSKTVADKGKSGATWSFYTGSSGTTTSLPSGWQSRDIGNVGIAGSASGSGSSFTVRGGGADVWGSADAFRFAYRSLAGDGTITARVASISGSEAWTKVGVMIRSSTSAGSAHAFMIVSKGKGLAFQRRKSSGGLTTSTAGGSGTAPMWVRLRRSGTQVTAYVSSNGSSWTTVGSDTISLSSTALVGLAVSSHTTSSLATANFDNVSVSP